MHNGAMEEVLPTRGFVFRLGFDCAFSSSDSDALERRLGSGLLLRHPQVSNQNSKRGGQQSIRREVVNVTPRKVSSFGLLFPSPSVLFHFFAIVVTE
jgi:hypothetical protein